MQKPCCLDDSIPKMSEATIAELVGQVFEAAPAADRSRLLMHLLKPLSVLSLVALANGIFAKIRFGSGWPDMQIATEDAQNVQSSDVVTLVNHVQQVSVNAIDGLAGMLAASQPLASTATAALLIAVLVRRARYRRAGDREVNESPVSLTRAG